MTSTSGSARVPGSRVATPLTATRPSRIRRSPPRRDARPAWARILFSRSFAIGSLRGVDLAIPRLRVRAEVGQREVALHAGEILEVAQAEGHEELARCLEEKWAPGCLLAAGDADQAPLEQVVEHALRVHPAH